MSVSAIICHPDARETRTHVAEMADPWGIKEADFEVRKEEQELLLGRKRPRQARQAP